MDHVKSLKMRIAKKNTAIITEREKQEIILTNLGQALYESDRSGCGDTVNQSVGKVQELEESLRTVLLEEEQKNAIDKERNTLNSQLRHLKSKAKSEHKELGRSVWNMWKTGFNIEGVEKALESLIHAEGRLLEQNDSFGTSFSSNHPGNLLTMGQNLIVKGRRKTTSANMERLLGRAGVTIFSSIDMQVFEDTPAAVPFAVLQNIQDDRQKIDLRLKELSHERKNLGSALDVPLSGLSSRKKIAGIEKSLSAARDILDEAFRNHGESCLQSGFEAPVDSDLAKLKAEWEKIDALIGEMEKEKEALEAHQQYRELEIQCNVRESLIQNLEAEIKKKQTRLKALKSELSPFTRDLKKCAEKLPPIPEEDAAE